MDDRDTLQKQRPISWAWVGVSLAIFLGVELLLGGVVSDMLEGRTTSHMLRLRIELGMSLLSYLAGGFVVGVVSPGVRLLEPAIGAAASVAFTFLIAFFTPLTFLHASGDRILVGGMIAFAVGLAGAWAGERLTGH